MKFRYGYRTKDNEKVEGVISASSREDVYLQLKREGKKPYAVEPLPGFFNMLCGIGKRWIAIAILVVLCAGLAIVAWRALRSAPQTAALAESLDSPVRRQPIGDAAVIEKGIRTGWADVFSLEGERFLASFAIPGVPAGLRNTTEEEIRKALDAVPSAFSRTGAAQSLEERQIRAIVEGMKQELRDFLADGGTIVGYGKRLVQRQEEELRYYNMVKRDLEFAVKSGKSDTALEELWESRNAKLRAMGIKLVPLPE